MLAIGRRIIARPAHTRIKTKALRLYCDIGFAHILKRRMDFERLAFRTSAGCDCSHCLKRLNEFRAAVGIARKIKGVDPDEKVTFATRFCQPSRQREADSVTQIGSAPYRERECQ